jgi:NAD(P)-dependent dehydrogenase (short-subunit alcohol dehydrogenase family)
MILKDKIVVISGIGPGLGRELALCAAREGAHLAIAARTAARLDALQREIEALDPGTGVVSRPTDIRDRAACERLVEAALAAFGRIDILINSAYIAGTDALAAEADLDDWRQTMEVNLFGSMNLIQAAVPHMRRAGGGSIVNVNTKVVRMPHETMGGYAVSKAALRMATTQLAKELGRYRIRVNSVFPGWMWGDTVERGLQAMAAAEGITLEQMRAKIARALPLGDIPEDGECAKSVLALASDYFTATTGACLDLSAGEYMPV